MTEIHDLYIKINDEYIRVGEGEVTTTHTLTTNTIVAQADMYVYFYLTDDPVHQWKHDGKQWYYRNRSFGRWVHSVDGGPKSRRDYTQVYDESDLPHGWEEHEHCVTNEDTPEPPSHISALSIGERQLFLVRDANGRWAWKCRPHPYPGGPTGHSWKVFAAEGYLFTVVK
jgi:hypothetical protein